MCNALQLGNSEGMEIVDILLFGVATVLFGIEAVRTRSLLAAGACAFALDFLIHALVLL